MPETALLVVVGVLGLVIGSFLNVVVWRVPRGESVVSPPSACPRCGRRLRPWENVPIASWLVLRGRCATCKEPISLRYPLVEGATALLFVGVALRFRDDWWALPAYWYLAAIGLALALIDVDVRRLPDAIVKPSYVVAAVLLTAATVGGAADWAALIRAAAGMTALGLLYLLLKVVQPRGMGWGDVKLSGVLGLYLGWLGWGSVVVGGFAAFLLGGLWGLALIATRQAGRRSKVPFGPWMILGAAVGVAWGEPLWSAYLGLIG
ncbi:MAG: prepilin peptidase [Actinomycetales bacterium]|nr:prepilin peptidase [Actinomycetales bacterium]